MSDKRFALAFTLLVCVGLWLLLKDTRPHDSQESLGHEDQPQIELAEDIHTDGLDSAPEVEERPDPNDPRLNRLPDGRVEYLLALENSRMLNAGQHPVETLYAFQDLFRHYQYVYKENPVGVENFEITRQLLGQNPMRVVFIAPDSPALEGDELVDQWGTPFFFHALSGTEMEVRSAGPDKKLWTEDDLHLDEM